MAATLEENRQAPDRGPRGSESTSGERLLGVHADVEAHKHEALFGDRAVHAVDGCPPHSSGSPVPPRSCIIEPDHVTTFHQSGFLDAPENVKTPFFEKGCVHFWLRSASVLAHGS